MEDGTTIALEDGVLTVNLPTLEAVRIYVARRIIAVDGISGENIGEGPFTLVDLRGGIYGDFHRLRPAIECFDRDCIGARQHRVIKEPTDAF